MTTAARFGLIALIALVLTVLPGGGSALDVVLTLLTIAFFAAIAFLLKFLVSHTTAVFVVYRIGLGVVVLSLVAAGVIS